MALLNFRDRNRLGRKHLVIILLLSFGLALSFSFIATTPGAAQDECTDTGRVANGGLDWYFPGYPLADGTFLPPMAGQSRFHIQECHHNQLAKGWGYISTETDGSWLLFSLSVEGGAMKVVHSKDSVIPDVSMNGWRVLDESGVEYNAEGEAAWMKAEIIDASDPAIVGQWVAGAVFDGGTPGKNGDLVFQVSPVDSGIADLFYDYGIMGIQLYPFWAPVVKGNLVVK